MILNYNNNNSKYHSLFFLFLYRALVCKMSDILLDQYIVDMQV